MTYESMQEIMNTFYTEVATLKEVLNNSDDFVDAILSMQKANTIEEVLHIGHSAFANLKATAEKRLIPEILLNDIKLMVDEIIDAEKEVRELAKLLLSAPSSDHTLH